MSVPGDNLRSGFPCMLPPADKSCSVVCAVVKGFPEMIPNLKMTRSTRELFLVNVAGLVTKGKQTCSIQYTNTVLQDLEKKYVRNAFPGRLNEPHNHTLR